MMSPRRYLLFVAAALVAAVLIVPVAGAGSGDVQTIRALAVRYNQLQSAGDPAACQLMTHTAQVGYVYAASMFTKTKLTSCPAAVEALAKLNESQYPNHVASARADATLQQALARGKVTVHGARATLDYTEVVGFVHSSSTIDFALAQNHWLVDA